LAIRFHLAWSGQLTLAARGGVLENGTLVNLVKYAHMPEHNSAVEPPGGS
jgi:hypothetical protein